MTDVSDDEKINREMARANQADLLLSNPLLAEACAELRQYYLNAWKNTKRHETAARERAWDFHQTSIDFEAHLRTWISDGKLASAQLKKDAKK